ncbi:mitochondrial brown fat uncoupling protein 1 isoform X2 [Felis catus]|uniref:mitochondrial brown fat uncoupling protein 1 isoform X2 n=1 Tax=Felis catus TaxID=9685 RepID=UPI001D1A3175|nr:mitochondrial brown fat uncoupling protein 1 isoform X2 [Felis catus]
MPARFPGRPKVQGALHSCLGEFPARQDLLPESPRSRLFRKPAPAPGPSWDRGWCLLRCALPRKCRTQGAGRRMLGARRLLSGWKPALQARGEDAGGRDLAPQGTPQPGPPLVCGDLASRSPRAAAYISHPALAGRTGASRQRALVLPGAREGRREVRPVPPAATARAPPKLRASSASLKSGSRFAVPAGQGRRGREKFHLAGARVLRPCARSSLRNLSEDGGPDSLGRAPDHGGQDLLCWRGGLCGGCDHLPAGHGQSPATGSERDGDVSQGEGGHLFCASL